MLCVRRFVVARGTPGAASTGVLKHLPSAAPAGHQTSMKRTAGDSSRSSTLPTVRVSGRFIRFPSDFVFNRQKVAKANATTVQPQGIVADGAADPHMREENERLRTQDVLDRAILVQCESHWIDLATHDWGDALEAPFPDLEDMEGGDFGENLLITGASADNLCVGDVLALVPSRSKRGKSAKGVPPPSPGGRGATLQLQIVSPRRPCGKVDQQFGMTWGGTGVRAHCAATARAGFFCKVLQPGSLTDGAELEVIERPHPNFSVSRVASLLYGMKGACDDPEQYTLPGPGTESGGTKGTGGGRRGVKAKWKGTEAELRELASMPELAAHEWGDEFRALLSEWEKGDFCAIS